MSVEEFRFWQLAYISVLSIRLHPRNAHGEVGISVNDAAEWAYKAANEAVIDYRSKIVEVSHVG